MDKEVIKIRIDGASGYCNIEEAYNDTLIIKQNSIKYKYIPVQESKDNPTRKWSYKTNSPVFEQLYRELVDLLPAVIDTDEKKVFCTDVGGFSFTFSYSDGSKWEKSFSTIGESFAYLFTHIYLMVPDCEYLPKLLELFNYKVFVSEIIEKGKQGWGLYYVDEGDRKIVTEDFKQLVFNTKAEAVAKLEAIEAERHSEDEAVSFSLEEAKEFAESHKWKFATTYAKTAPHEYLVKRWLSEEDRLLFERLVQTIKEHAVVGYFYDYPNDYLILGDKYYWYMPVYPENMAVDLINRTTTDYLELRNGVYHYKAKTI